MPKVPILDYSIYRMGQPKVGSSTSRILVADNQPRVRKQFVGMLQSAGYTVSEASSGRKTLDALRNKRFHVLVLDLDMPTNGGFDVLKALRAEMPHLRVLVISMKPELLEAAEWFGAVATINRVRAPDLLLRTVSRLLV